MLIQTDRCLIRPFVLEDLDAFMSYRNQMEWMRFQGFKGLTREAYQEALLAPIAETKGFQLAIVRKSDAVLIGDLYLKRESSDCVIGYTVAPDYARQRYATEAVHGAMAWALDQGFQRMVAWVDPANTASICFLKRLGYASIQSNEDGELGFAYALHAYPSPT